MAARTADVMRPFLLAALGAFDIRCRCEPVVSPAHIAPRRRCFSLGDRHGGTTPSKRLAQILEHRRLGRRQVQGPGWQSEPRSEQETVRRFKQRSFPRFSLSPFFRGRGRVFSDVRAPYPSEALEIGRSPSAGEHADLKPLPVSLRFVIGGIWAENSGFGGAGIIVGLRSSPAPAMPGRIFPHNLRASRESGCRQEHGNPTDHRAPRLSVDINTELVYTVTAPADERTRE
jgi:hypothetical protein